MSSVLMLALLLTTLTLVQAGNLTLYAVAVGQGDCNIIQCPNGQDIIIVDMGAKKGQYVDHTYITHLLKDKFDVVSKGKRIHIIITHPHQDHYNYISKVMSSGLVGNVQETILGGRFSEYQPAFRNWLKQQLPNSTYSMKDNCLGNSECRPMPVPGFGRNREIAGDPWQFCGDGVNVTVLGANLGNTNNSHSVVLRLVYKQWSLFMAGDFEGIGPQKKLINTYSDQELKSTYYKAAHHGAWTKDKKPNWPELLKKIQPKRVYISQAYPSISYHHPSCQTIFNLQMIGSIDKISKNLNRPFACWNETSGNVTQFSGMDLAIYETCRSFSSGKQVCQDVWVESDGRCDNTQYVSVPEQYVKREESLEADGSHGNMEPWERV